MGGKSAKQKVTDYYMSIHFGICLGVVDKIKKISIGEKTAWSGEVTDEDTISVNKRSLFGGSKKEGGVAGQIHFTPGSFSPDPLPSKLASKLGGTPSTVPAFMGLATTFFTASGSGGFLWATTNAYLKKVWFRVSRVPNVIPAAAGEPSSYSVLVDPDAGELCNPAHVIYEACTNSEWGRGLLSSQMDIESFQEAAKTLYEEDFMIAFVWDNDAGVESLFEDLFDMIQGTIYNNRENGKISMKLYRDDYVVGDLPTLDKNNSTLKNFDRVNLGNLVNEMQIVYTNPVNEEDMYVNVQDLAMVQSQGNINSETKKYLPVRTAGLALKLGMRDLRRASYPLAKGTLELSSGASRDISPGGLFKLNYPDLGYNNIIMRVTDIESPSSNQDITQVSCVEDVFSLTGGNFTTPQNTEWVDGSQEPQDVDDVLFFTLPYFMAIKVGADPDFEDPDIGVGAVPLNTLNDVSQYTIYLETTNAGGDSTYQYIDEIYHSPKGVTIATLSAEASTTATVSELGLTSNYPSVGGFLYIDGGSEELSEIVYVQSISGTTVTLQRGVLDTIPREWPIATDIYSLEQYIDYGIEYIFTADELNTFKFLMMTSLGEYDQDLASEVTFTGSDRPHLPLRPTNVKVDGTGFGTVNHVGTSDINVTWAIRNRLLEDQVIAFWTDASMSAETDQTTTVQIWNTAEDSLLQEYTGLTGTSQAVPVTDFGVETEGVIKVFSKKATLESLQSHKISVTLS